MFVPPPFRLSGGSCQLPLLNITFPLPKTAVQLLLAGICSWPDNRMSGRQLADLTSVLAVSSQLTQLYQTEAGAAGADAVGVKTVTKMDLRGSVYVHLLCDGHHTVRPARPGTARDGTTPYRWAVAARVNVNCNKNRIAQVFSKQAFDKQYDENWAHCYYGRHFEGTCKLSKPMFFPTFSIHIKK